MPLNLEEFKKVYANERLKQEEYRKHPDSTASKKAARVGGLVLFVLGLIMTGINYYTWTYHGFIRKWPLAVNLAFLGLGLYLIIKGKMPGRRI